MSPSHPVRTSRESFLKLVEDYTIFCGRALVDRQPPLLEMFPSPQQLAIIVSFIGRFFFSLTDLFFFACKRIAGFVVLEAGRPVPERIPFFFTAHMCRLIALFFQFDHV